MDYSRNIYEETTTNSKREGKNDRKKSEIPRQFNKININLIKMRSC